MAARAASGPAVWPWLLLLLASLALGGGILWDVGPGLLELNLAPRRPAAPAAAGPAPGAQVERRRLRLFLPDPGTRRFRETEREIARGESLAEEVRTAIRALHRESPPGEPPLLSPQVRLRHLFLDSFGVLYLDLTGELQPALARPPAQAELAVASLVNSLTGSFAEVKRVQLLLEGREVVARAGDLDLSRPLSPHFPRETGLPGGDSPPAR